VNFSTQQFQDLVPARESLRLAGEGVSGIDFASASSMVDRVLATTCPHDVTKHHQAPDTTNGRPLTTCYECGVSWYADYEEQLKTN
jgi:hypothetical protein